MKPPKRLRDYHKEVEDYLKTNPKKRLQDNLRRSKEADFAD